MHVNTAVTGVLDVDMDGHIFGCAYECAGSNTGLLVFLQVGMLGVLFQCFMYTRELLGR